MKIPCCQVRQADKIRENNELSNKQACMNNFVFDKEVRKRLMIAIESYREHPLY